MTKCKKEQKHGIPALFSLFIPGFGQLIKGHFGRAFLIFFGMILHVLLIIMLIGFITLPIFWVWNVYDAYNG